MKNLSLELTKIFFVIAIAFTTIAMANAQDRNINGIVTDKDGITLVGVIVLQSNTNNGTTTNEKGEFKLQVPVNRTALTISYIGYKKKEVIIGEESYYKIVLEEDLSALNEVVVVGYGVQKKSDLTGSVASVSGDKLSRTMALGTEQALQGKAAGVQIISNTGMPSSGVTIKIRGTSSISSNKTDPIVIIDGMPGNLNSVNPNDIESIEVLKDASSQAIYGASGGNGVILITTKKGKSGRIQTDFNFYRGIQSPWKKMDVMDANEFADFYNKNVSIPKTGANYFTNLDSLPSVNWQDEIFRQSIMEDYNIRISGGNEISKVMFSAGYGNMEGIVKETYLKRFNFRINADHQLSKRIKFGESISFDTREFKDMYANNDYGGYVNQAITAIPATTIKNPDGLYSVSLLGGTNPVGRMYYTHNLQHQYSLNANSFIQIDLIKNLYYEMRLGASLGISDGFSFVPTYVTTDPTWQNPRSSITNSNNKSMGWNWQNLINYNFNINNNYNFSIMAGSEASSGTSDYMRGTRYDLRMETDHWQVLDGSINEKEQLVSGNKYEYRRNAIFGRLNFSYKDKYLLTSSIRRDGSYNFGPNYRYGTFPSFSLGWKFTSENFFPEIAAISFGKLRFGWGETGNSDIEAFSYIPLIQSVYTDGYFFDDAYQVGAARSKPANNDLHWEAMVSSNIGLDMDFFNNKLSFTLDLFEKHNDGMLVQQNIPGYVGRYATNPANEGGDTRPVVNVGKISNKGIEFTLSYKKHEGDFQYNIDFNISAVQTKIVSITETMIDGKYFGGALNNLTISQEGFAPYLFYGYKTNGIFTTEDDTITEGKKLIVRNQPFRIVNGKKLYLQASAQPGDIRFVDINQDSILNTKDMTVIGDPNPKFTFGLTGSFSYKIFDLTYAIQGSYGNQIFNALKIQTYNNTGSSNWVTERLNSYRMPTKNDPGNTNTNQFRVDPKNANFNLRQSDWYVEDGSYARLKSIQLGLTLPESLSSKLKITKCRVFIGANNLITITKYSGMEPEIGPVSRLAAGIDLGAYPQAKTIMIGANISF